MFWSNVKLAIQEKECDWGKLRFVQLGEYGRGRKPINISLPDSITEDIKAKEMLPYEIKLSKTSRPKLVDFNGTDTFIAIDTLGAYIRGAEGKIEFLANQGAIVRPIAFGWGAFGDAGRVGYAPAALLKVLPYGIIRYKMTRSSWEIVQVTEAGGVMHFSTQEIEPAIDADVLKLSGDWQKEDWTSIQSLFGKEV